MAQTRPSPSTAIRCGTGPDGRPERLGLTITDRVCKATNDEEFLPSFNDMGPAKQRNIGVFTTLEFCAA